MAKKIHRSSRLHIWKHSTNLALLVMLLPLFVWLAYQQTSIRSSAVGTPETVMHTAAYTGNGCYTHTSTQINSMATNGTRTYTIEFWLKPYSNVTSPQYILSSGHTYDTVNKRVFKPHWDITLRQGKLQAEIRSLNSLNQNIYAVATSSSVLATSPSTWSHVALVRIEDELKLFINGKLDTAPVRFVPDITTQNFDIGMNIGCQKYTTITQYQRNTVYQNNFTGLIDDLRITTSALYPTDTFTNTFVPPAYPLIATSAKVIGLWHFNDPSGSTRLSKDTPYYSFDTFVQGSWTPILSDIPGASVLATPSPLPVSPTASPTASSTPTLTTTPTSGSLNWCPGPNGASSAWDCNRCTPALGCTRMKCPPVTGTCQNNICTKPTETPTHTSTATPTAINTQVRWSTPSPSVASTKIHIYAAGTPYTGVYPTMELRINGNTVKRFTDIRGNAALRLFTRYTYTLPRALAPQDVLRIHFTNSSQSDGNLKRKLRIDRVVINNISYQSEASTTYSTGTWSSSTNSCDKRYARSEWLHCNGYFQYSMGL